MCTHVHVRMCLLLKNFTWSAKEFCVSFLKEYKYSKDLTLDAKERRNGQSICDCKHPKQLTVCILARIGRILYNKLLLVFVHTPRKCFKGLSLFRLLTWEIFRSGFHTKKKASRYVHILNERGKKHKNKSNASA